MARTSICKVVCHGRRYIIHKKNLVRTTAFKKVNEINHATHFGTYHGNK